MLLGTVIKQLRERSGYSQSELADKIQTIPSYIVCIEENKVIPPEKDLRNIGYALGVPYELMFPLMCEISAIPESKKAVYRDLMHDIRKLIYNLIEPKKEYV